MLGQVCFVRLAQPRLGQLFVVLVGPRRVVATLGSVLRTYCEDLAGIELLVFDLDDRKSVEVPEQPGCDVVPADSAEQYHVPGQVICPDLGCELVEYPELRRILCSDMSMQFDQRVEVAVRMHMCVVGVLR